MTCVIADCSETGEVPFEFEYADFHTGEARLAKVMICMTHAVSSMMDYGGLKMTVEDEPVEDVE